MNDEFFSKGWIVLIGWSIGTFCLLDVLRVLNLSNIANTNPMWQCPKNNHCVYHDMDGAEFYANFTNVPMKEIRLVVG